MTPPPTNPDVVPHPDPLLMTGPWRCHTCGVLHVRGPAALLHVPAAHYFIGLQCPSHRDPTDAETH
jgi:hypothetical protein